ncbi:hypothetical protein EDB80DRAFT_733333 [Ilyonectria destructans]|nr:hypothetical protein EDB80DRAFT_733333 [Ilyonectria destructans]
MRSKNWASNFHLMPLLQLAAYGMTDVVAVAVGAIEVGDNISRNKAHWARDSTPFLPTSAERVNCGNLTFGFPSATEWKNAMFNKRFFIGVCHFQNHWTSFIFDRVDRHLHHYDTLSVAREERFRTVGLAFREALSSAGLPYTFSAFGLPVTAQPGQWECGYLSVYVMLCNLRGMVGLSGEELRGMKQPTIVKFDQTCIGSPTTSALRHRDWVLTPWVASSSIDLTHVKEFISIAILDELGIKDLTFLDGDTQINMGSGPRRDVRIKGTTLLLPAKNLYTDLGGLQFICWKERPYTHKFYSNRVVMPPTKANQYYRRDSTVPQLPVLFVTLPDQLITRYESRDCTVIDKATPIRKDTQAPASNPTNTTRPKSQNTKQDSHSKGADAENRLSNHTPYAIRT